MQLRVTAIQDDGGYWGVDVRTLRQAQKVARRLRWQHGYPTWISDFNQPGDRHTIDAWRTWQARQRWLREARDAWQQPVTHTLPF